MMLSGRAQASLDVDDDLLVISEVLWSISRRGPPRLKQLPDSRKNLGFIQSFTSVGLGRVSRDVHQ